MMISVVIFVLEREVILKMKVTDLEWLSRNINIDDKGIVILVLDFLF